MKCLTSCPGFRKTTCDWATQLVRLHMSLPDAQQMPNSKISSLLARLDRRILKSPPKPQCLNVTQTFFLTETPCQLLKKATLAKIMFNWLTKNSSEILSWCWAYFTVLTEEELCLDFQWSHNNSAVADGHVLHFLPDTLNSALTCLLELGLRNWALSLGED